MAEESISGNPEEDEVKADDSIQEVYILISIHVYAFSELYVI